MYTKSYTFALLAIWLFNACLAAPSPDPKAEPCGACINPCTVERCHNIPITSHIPIKTTHRIIPSSNWGYGSGLGSYGGWGLGGWGGCGNGWNYGGYGGYGGWGGDCGIWGNGGWGGWSGNLGCGWGHGGWGGYGSCY